MIMNKFIDIIVNYLFALPSIELASRWPLYLLISAMRILNKIELSTAQLKAISIIVKEKAPCKLLIYGVGYDSAFWSKINKDGVTIFLEDNNNWYQSITTMFRDLTVFLIAYNTKRSGWKMLLDSPSLLDMALPNIVETEKWDVILVDGPNGQNDQSTGRMKSIFLSSRLIKNSGDIFVHDCNREVEDIYCNRFLKEENLKIENRRISRMFKALPDDKSLHLTAFPLCSQATGEHVVRLEKRKLRIQQLDISAGKDYRVRGEPTDIGSARQLASENRYQFQ